MFVFLYFFTVVAVMFALLRMAFGANAMGQGGGRDMTAIVVPIITLGWALSLFLSITYLVCVGFDLIFPGYAMYESWMGLMPGMTWLTLPSFLLGLAWSFLYGWFAALLFGGLFNAFSARA